MVMMDIVQGVCIFCTENDSVLSDENKRDFLKIIKINFFSNNRFNFSEFSKLFNKLSICLLCAYKVQCCSNIRHTFKKGDTTKSKRNQDKCCSLCYKTDYVTNGTEKLKKEVNQFAKDIKKGNNVNIKYICLSCSFSVTVWGSIVTAIWNLLNDESADSEKENVAKTNAKNKNLDTTETENKIEITRSTRLRARPSTENDNKSKTDNSAKVNNKSDESTSRNVGKRQKETIKNEPEQEEKTKITRKRSIGDSHNDVTSKKKKISARVNSESAPEENLKQTRRKSETARHSIEESVSDSTPVQTKKSRQSEDISTPKILRTPNTRLLKTNSGKKRKRITAHYTNGVLDKKLKHLNTVNRETRKKNMHLSYNAVTDQRIMFEIPYILCTPHDVDSFITKKTKTTSSEESGSSNEDSLSSEKSMGTKKGSKRKEDKRSTKSIKTTSKGPNKRQTRSKKTYQENEIIVIDISSTDEETVGETSQSSRRSARIRKPTPKAVIQSKKGKLSTSIKKATKIQFQCTECNEYFPTLHKMTLHKEKHHTPSSPTSELSNQNSEHMETNEFSDKNTEDNNTESEEESDKQENISSADIEGNNVEPSDKDNSNINGETNETDENTEVTKNNEEKEEEVSKKNEEKEEVTKNNQEEEAASIDDEDIKKSNKELDTDENVTEEISEAQNIDKNEAEVETTTEENVIVEITDKQASDKKSINNDNIDINTAADKIEEKDNNIVNDKDTNNTDNANEETEDNKLIGNDENSNEKSDTETVILNENNVEQITNDIIEDICEFTDVTDIQDSEETSIDDKALEENANIKELTEENADLMQSNNIVQDENDSTEKLNNEQKEENQGDDSKKPEEKDKIQEETSIPAKESISEISLSETSSQDNEISERNLIDILEITEDESPQTTSTCGESVIANINDQETANIADNKNVPTCDISSLPEEDSEMESLKISSQNSSGSNISSIGKTETGTAVTDESNQKSNEVITIENNFQQKESIEDFAIVEDILENMGA